MPRLPMARNFPRFALRQASKRPRLAHPVFKTMRRIKRSMETAIAHFALWSMRSCFRLPIRISLFLNQSLRKPYPAPCV